MTSIAMSRSDGESRRMRSLRDPGLLATSSRAKPDHWLGVEPKHLATLTAIAAEASFRGAARRLGCAQSAVSQHIAALEGAVGTRLIDRSRGPGRVALTDAGFVLLDHAEGILARLVAARADMNACAEGNTTAVRVGVEETSATYVMPSIVERLARDSADVELHPTQVSTDPRRLAMLERGALDVAFVDLPVGGGPFEVIEVLVDPYMLVVWPEHPLAALDRPLTMADLSGLTWLTGPSIEFLPGHSTDRLAGFGLPAAIILTLVAAGNGVAVVPGALVDGGRPDLVTISLGALIPPRVLGVCRRRDRDTSDAVAAFLRALADWRLEYVAAHSPGSQPEMKPEFRSPRSRRPVASRNAED
jgi:DNA-binding transcriptional LysR family regulator